MNGNFRTHSDDDPDEGLDPDLTRLFDTSSTLEPVTGVQTCALPISCAQHTPG